MVLRISRLLSLVAGVALLPMSFIPTASADERITDDYIALVFEAEDDDTRGERWVLMNSSTPEQENDPDGNHSDGAAGGAYIELLPDMRVTHEDTFGPPTAIWNERGTGPRAEYTMNFPEAGRYYVHIRAYSTGTEDNGIHVGLNDEFPLSGARMQFCTAGLGWQWSSKQRDSGGVGPCGTKKTIWITVEEPGDQTFMISAREDGFEADRIMLIKDLSNNTRICSPSGVDDIVCENGSLENVDEVVDMAVSSTIDHAAIELGSAVVVSIIIRNNDGYDRASDVVLSVGEGVGTQWDAVDLPEGCQVVESSVNCDLGSVGPSSPGEEGNTEFEITLEALQGGALEIPVSIETSSIDDNQNNDAANQSVTVTDDGSTLSALTLNLANENPSFQSDMETRITSIVGNTGPAVATDVVLNVSVPVGLTMSSLPAECAGTTEVQCNLDTLAVDAQVSLDFGITPVSAGIYSVGIDATASNMDGDSPGRSMIVQVEEIASGDSGDTGGTGGTTDGATDGGNDGVVVTDSDTAAKADAGALVWWVLMLLTFVLYTRQIHITRLKRRSRLAVSRGVS